MRQQHVSDNGGICLVLPHGTLFNHSPTALEFAPITLIRSGLRSLLERDGEFQVVAEASDGHEAIELATQHRPDVILLDVGMPRISGPVSSPTLWNTPRRMRCWVMSRKKRSTIFSHEALVGVWCIWKRLCLPSHRCTLTCL